MWEAYKKMWKRAFDFKGRSTRSDFWKAYMMNLMLLTLPYMAITLTLLTWFGSKTYEMTGFFQFMNVMISTYSFISIVPILSLAIRRLHDSNRSGWWFLINVIPTVGNLVFVWFLLIGSKNDNRFPA